MRVGAFRKCIGKNVKIASDSFWACVSTVCTVQKEGGEKYLSLQSVVRVLIQNYSKRNGSADK